MNFSMENGVFTVSLTAVATFALALLVLLLGQKIKDRSVFLQKYCIPAPVVGGVLFALLNLLLHQTGWMAISMNTTYQSDMQNMFFTCIGFTVTASLLKKGGKRLVMYIIMGTILAVLQGVFGVLVAKGIGAEEWLGLMCGPATLSGGHGNAVAYGEILDNLGHSGTVVGVASATFGLVTGAFFGGPLAERLIRRNHLSHITNKNEDRMADQFLQEESSSKEPVTGHAIFSHVALVASLVVFGQLTKLAAKQFLSVTIIEYAGAAMLACVLANINEKKNIFRINQHIIDGISEFTLGVFLSMAMMSLKLWELAGLALPMVIILLAELIMTLLYIYFAVFRACGKDYDAAVMCAGMTGHGLGASPAGIANMDSVTSKFGESKISYLCVAVFGGILVDWVLIFINTTMVNLFA